MNHAPNRRDVLKAVAATAATTTLSPVLTSAWGETQGDQSLKQWFKGNLHQHNQWSDGQPLAEWAIEWYKSHGYHFVCPSDHNIFQSDELRFDGFGFNNEPADRSAFKGETSLWKVVSQRYVDETIEKFGADSVRRLTVGDKTYVRMTPFDELAEQFEEPDRFLMIPGFEQTGGCHNGQQVHINLINVREIFPYKKFETPEEILRHCYEESANLYSDRPYLFIANHPLWRYYDFSPNDLIALPQIRIFELNNNAIAGGFDAHPQGWKPEKFWDVVNAHRAAHDQPLLLGMGSDDRHSYGDDPKAWCVVRAASLETSQLINAMAEGDFYASNGLNFTDIQFDGKTLSVKVDPKVDGSYRIDFIGTKKDYDPSSRSINAEKTDRSPARKIDVYSDSIGVVLDSVPETEAAYTLKDDDLYVRAKVTLASNPQDADWESRPAAWTQPYC